MPLSDLLDAARLRASRELDATHDYLVHSKAVWTLFESQVAQGFQLSLLNVATGTAIDQADLVKLGAEYRVHYLATFTFRQFVSTFEVFLFEFLHRLLLHNPWQFGGKRLEFETVLRAKDRDEIIFEVVAKQLNELKYEKLRDWFDFMNKAMKLPCPSEDEIDALAEVKASRDIIEHNAGVVNEVYLRKAGKKARFAVGDRVVIDESYHNESWRLMKKVINDLTAAALAKQP